MTTFYQFFLSVIIINLKFFLSNQAYDYRQEQSLYKNFNPYLLTQSYINSNCGPNSGLGDFDLSDAFQRAEQQISEVRANNIKFIEMNPYVRNFSSYLYEANLQSKYNEFATKNLAILKCLSRYETETKLRSIPIASSSFNENNFCDLESMVSPSVKCNPKYKYSRIDGKCNNLVNTNWGSSYNCQRRLLLPDYADGVSDPRVASDGSALPDPRYISNSLMPRISNSDQKLSSMHMQWGQLIAHDTVKSIQHFGNAIDCCKADKSLVHRECMASDNFPPDPLTNAYNVTCLGFVRSIGSNTCSLGHRMQLNAATSVLDLSNVYGGNNNNSEYIRSFKKGGIHSGTALDGSDILPKASLRQEQDRIDLQPCNTPSDEPWLTCLLTGDGIRGNQQPMIMSMHIILKRRHMQHADAFSKVNPHWDDEKLFQEARQLLIAEVNKIHYYEYFPSVLNKETLDFYHLNAKSDGFTEYNPNVDPTIIQSVGAAAFRFGHSQVSSRFQALKRPGFKTYGFKLRFKYEDMTDIWEGNTNGIIGGLSSQPTEAVDPYFTPDVHDYLFFRQKSPDVRDLSADNINRGRDHGVPAYVYYVEYCSGVPIMKWSDLIQFIPEDYVRQLATVYKNVRDIDLFVGGLAERPVNGSILGPTFSCLMGIQIYHWKYGDRFYFEHGGQSGSFNLEQLNNIRSTASLANLLCKTTDFDSIQLSPMFMPSESNPRVSCQKFCDFDYTLWRQYKQQ